MKIIVTGAAGFIGSAVALRLLQCGHEVLGIDNVNDYYDVSLKRARLERTKAHPAFIEARIHLEDRASISKTFANFKPVRVIHFASQVGVRYSIKNPYAYVDSNLVGFINVLEACRHNGVGHLIYASSSSVYGANAKPPFSTGDNTYRPLSLYAATKKAAELMAYTYSHAHRLPTTCLRFFTIYGPWGRPDMALFIFTRNILAGRPIDVFNHGNHRRDFTYIDDAVESVMRVFSETHPGEIPGGGVPYRLYNVGCGNPVGLKRCIRVLENCLGKKARQNPLPLQAGDVLETSADTKDLMADTGYTPSTSIEEGIKDLVDWYRRYYQV